MFGKIVILFDVDKMLKNVWVEFKISFDVKNKFCEVV